MALVDATSARDCTRLVATLSRPRDDADAVAERLLRVFTRFPPTEAQMRKLSLAQQALCGTGGVAEFCVVTVYHTATLALCESPVHSTPILHVTELVTDAIHRGIFANRSRHPHAMRRVRALRPTRAPELAYLERAAEAYAGTGGRRDACLTVLARAWPRTVEQI